MPSGLWMITLLWSAFRKPIVALSSLTFMILAAFRSAVIVGFSVKFPRIKSVKNLTTGLGVLGMAWKALIACMYGSSLVMRMDLKAFMSLSASSSLVKFPLRSTAPKAFRPWSKMSSWLEFTSSTALTNDWKLRFSLKFPLSQSLRSSCKGWSPEISILWKTFAQGTQEALPVKLISLKAFVASAVRSLLKFILPMTSKACIARLSSV
mmetsp:Transcript_19310/g.60699  ORF Transcript_19310/g.60699 Transcript_19310/m.60699 type:complete len:208 (+) Transcript_19310:645-1268(+)